MGVAYASLLKASLPIELQLKATTRVRLTTDPARWTRDHHTSEVIIYYNDPDIDMIAFCLIVVTVVLPINLTNTPRLVSPKGKTLSNNSNIIKENVKCTNLMRRSVGLTPRS